jgi:hypothetical protein
MTVRGLSLKEDGITNLRHFANVCPAPAGKKHMRAIATLYDRHTASMFGSQCFSNPIIYSHDLTLDAGALRFDFDVFWHTRNHDPSVVLLVQITMAQLGTEDVLVNEYCVGWCRLPISVVSSRILHMAYLSSVEYTAPGQGHQSVPENASDMCLR